MFARINHELEEREKLEQARQALLKKKQGLIADNKKRKDDLASLDKDLETFIDVSFRRYARQDEEADRLVSVRQQNRYRKFLKSNTDFLRGCYKSNLNVTNRLGHTTPRGMPVSR